MRHVALDEETGGRERQEPEAEEGGAPSARWQQWEIVSWPLRTALSCLVSSLVYLTPLDDNSNGPLEGRLLAPIAASICSLQLLGETCRTGLWVTRGSVMGGCVGYAALGLLRGESGQGFSSVHLYLFQALFSVFLLFAKMPAVQHKLAWALITISVASALEQGEAVDGTRPLKVMLASLIGVASALAVNLLPWPEPSRAKRQAEVLVDDAHRQAARTVSNLCRALALSGPASGANEEARVAECSRAGLMAQAEQDLRDAETWCDRAEQIMACVDWEPRGGGGRQDVQECLGKVRKLTLAAGGMFLGAVARQELSELGGAIGSIEHMATKLLRDEDIAEGDEGDDGDEEDEEGGGFTRAQSSDAQTTQKGLAWVGALVDEQKRQEEFLDGRLSNHWLNVGQLIESVTLKGLAREAADAKPQWHPKSEPGSVGDHRRGGGRPQCQEREELAAAVLRLDTELAKVRKQIYYSGRSLSDACYQAFGPPMDRFCFIFCLQECSRITLDMGCLEGSKGQGDRGQGAKRVVESPSAGERARAEVYGWWEGVVQTAQDMRAALEWFGGDDVSGKWSLEEVAASRGAYAVKLTAANLLAMQIGTLMTQSGLWAAVAVCFIGPRDSTRAGGGFRIGILRVVGTVFGSMWGYLTAFVTQAGGQLGVGHLSLLAVWVLISGFFRTNPSTAYGAQVSQFTPYIMIEAPLTNLGASVLADGIPQGFSSWAWRRIQQNIIAVVSFMLIELSVLPTLSSHLLRKQVVSNLRTGAAATRDIFLAGTASMCLKCREAKAASAGEGIAGMERGLKQQRVYLSEARDEAHWNRGRRSDMLRAFEDMIEMQSSQLTRLLSLMQSVVDLWSHWQDQEGNLSRISHPTRSALLRLQQRLADWLERIAHDVEGAREAQLGLAAFESAESVRRSLVRFQAAYFRVILQISREHRDGGHSLPRNEAIVPLHALIFCTRELVTTTSSVAKCAGRLCDRRSRPGPAAGQGVGGTGGLESKQPQGAVLAAQLSALAEEAESGGKCTICSAVLPGGGGAGVEQGEPSC